MNTNTTKAYAVISDAHGNYKALEAVIIQRMFLLYSSASVPAGHGLSGGHAGGNAGCYRGLS